MTCTGLQNLSFVCGVSFRFMYVLKCIGSGNTALLWQKEASDKLPKSEKVMFLDLDLAC